MRTPAALALALLLAACGKGEAPASAASAPPLRTAAAEVRDVQLAISADAVVEAVHQSTVSAQLTGRIVDIRFDVGDRVKKGEVIARIDERGATQALAASEAQVREAEAGLANARSQYERSRQLLAQGFISPAALDKSEADFKAAESRLKAMLAGAGQAATERSFTTITAPYSGVVSARHVQLGEMATPGRPLMTGFDPASLRVVATLSSIQAQRVQPGTRTRIEVPSANRWLDAKSITVVPAADPRTHATQVRVELPADVSGIYPGVFARAHFVVGTAPRLMVPREAVFQRSEVTAVYVIEPSGQPRLRQVRLGTASDERSVEVLAGVKPGEAVALEPLAAASRALAAR
jgi:RND family efflux transporter MFP subunit